MFPQLLHVIFSQFFKTCLVCLFAHRYSCFHQSNLMVKTQNLGLKENFKALESALENMFKDFKEKLEIRFQIHVLRSGEYTYLDIKSWV